MPPKKAIHIKPSHEGIFTAKAKAHGETVQEYAVQVRKQLKRKKASGKKLTEAEKKLQAQAVFARNAKTKFN